MMRTRTLRMLAAVTVCAVSSTWWGCGASDASRGGMIGPSPIAPSEVAPPPVVGTPPPVITSRTPPFAGVWTGMFEVSSCVGASSWCPTTSTEPFLLNLDGELNGVAEMEPERGLPIAVDVTQTQDAAGNLLLQGSSTIPLRPRLDLEIRLSGSAPTGLAGSVRYTVSGVRPGAYDGVATRSGNILFMRQVTTVRVGALQGTWRGQLNRTACSGDCSPWDEPTREMTLYVSQQDDVLSATLDGTPLEGTASGREFMLHRDFKTSSCKPIGDSVSACTDVVVFSGSVDSLDRMRGTIQRIQAGEAHGSGPYSWTKTFELVGVVRQR